MNLQTFIDHFSNLINFVYKKDGYIRKHASEGTRRTMSKILKDLVDINEHIKDKKERENESICSKNKDICDFLWNL